MTVNYLFACISPFKKKIPVYEVYVKSLNILTLYSQVGENDGDVYCPFLTRCLNYLSSF